MTKQMKPKTGKTRNDDRKNGKAYKKSPGKSKPRREAVTEVEKILLGGGLLAKWRPVLDGKMKGIR